MNAESVLQKFRNKVINAITEELTDIGQDILTRSTSYVPVDTGFLRDSGSSVVEVTPSKIRTVVRYTAPYAIYVHENLNAHHNVGQAKFLERAGKEVLQEAADRIKTRVSETD
jgi:hypothetical protein